jgi:hypothetical protein
MSVEGGLTLDGRNIAVDGITSQMESEEAPMGTAPKAIGIERSLFGLLENPR